VIREELLPGGVTKTTHGARRVHDVGHEEGRHDALVLARHADGIAVAREVENVHRLVADDPGIVAGRDVANVERPELNLFTVLHPHREATREEDLDVVDRTRRSSRRRSHVRRPPPAGLLDAVPDGVGADPDDPDQRERKVSSRVRIVERLAPDRTHTQW
jgi:hypothetical protein